MNGKAVNIKRHHGERKMEMGKIQINSKEIEKGHSKKRKLYAQNTYTNVAKQ